MSDSGERDRPPIILFDGVCALCNSSVDFVLKRDRSKRFRFAALQSEAGKRVLREHGVKAPEPGSVVLIEDGAWYHGSTAALRIARGLRFPWWLLYGLIVVPRPARDAVYGWIARNRYRWFGRREACRMPTPEEAERFIE